MALSILKSIDGLMDYKIMEYDEMLSRHNGVSGVESVYHSVLSNDTKLVLKVLKTKTNKPSVHDLFLLSACKDIRDMVAGYKYAYDRTGLTVLDGIIEFYKNRKES